MNLVAKEFVAAQNPDDPGVLVLSRFAGAARECTAALLSILTTTKASRSPSTARCQCRCPNAASAMR